MNDDTKIEITKGAEFLRTAGELSDVIAALPLTAEQNNKLIQCIIEHTTAASKEAFAQGLILGATGGEVQNEPRRLS